jgi:hypothetical protein
VARAEFFDQTFARRRPRQQLEVLDGHSVAVDLDDVTSGLLAHDQELEIAGLPKDEIAAVCENAPFAFIRLQMA